MAPTLPNPNPEIQINSNIVESSPHHLNHPFIQLHYYFKINQLSGLPNKQSSQKALAGRIAQTHPAHEISMFLRAEVEPEDLRVLLPTNAIALNVFIYNIIID